MDRFLQNLYQNKANLKEESDMKLKWSDGSMKGALGSEYHSKKKRIKKTRGGGRCLDLNAPSITRWIYNNCLKQDKIKWF